MAAYLARRFVLSLLTLWVIITLTFVLMHAIPGDPFMSDARISPQAMENLRRYYGLDRPLPVQYGRYMANLARGDLGRSLRSEVRDINQIIADGLPISALLGAEALIVAVLGGITFGVLAALGHNRVPDHLSMGTAIVGISVPGFILATLLIDVFAVRLGILPVATWGTWKHTVMPAFSLALAPLAYLARLTRSSMLEELGQDYVKAAVARGLSRPRVIVGHALRNALAPATPLLAGSITWLVGGVVVVETVFNYPGVSRDLVHAISQRDLPYVQSVTLLIAAVTVAGYLLADLAVVLLVPTLRSALG
ncbi:MAG: ABC transporter permease [Longimicrobiales bacterium]